MEQSLDITQTAADLANAVQGQLQDGWETISGFVVSQSKLLATQAAWIAESRISGVLKTDDDLFEMFTGQLEDSIKSFAMDIAARVALTLQEVWNAAAGILQAAINKVLSSATMGIVIFPALPPV